MPQLIDNSTGQVQDVSHEQLGPGFLSGQYALPDNQPVHLVNPNGEIHQVDPSQVYDAVTKAGYSFPTTAQVVNKQQGDFYGSPAEATKLFLESFANTTTLGGSSVIENALLHNKKEQALRQQYGPTTAKVLGIGAGIIGAPEEAPLGLLGKLGGAITEAATPAIEGLAGNFASQTAAKAL